MVFALHLLRRHYKEHFTHLEILAQSVPWQAFRRCSTILSERMLLVERQ